MPGILGMTKEELVQGFRERITMLVDLADVADGDILTDYPCDYAGEVVALRIITSEPVTTASKASTVEVQIGSTAVTGTSTALTSANMGTLGVVKDSAATGNKAFDADDTLSLVASSTTAFIEGSAMFEIVLRRTA